jgi:1-deoxy-D-xylulose-5-phosphate reductoisomerase
VLNAANEECVAAFLEGGLPFVGIVDTVAAVVAEHRTGERLRNDLALADVLDAESWARSRARELVGR